ncbi:MAG: ChaN family lipoprotein, partial [Polaromonas sp.]|nr:ChaN family lipoprotein [Gemmatimonadaceae bacterium]
MRALRGAGAGGLMDVVLCARRQLSLALAAVSMMGCTSIARVIAALPSAPSPLLSGIRIVSPHDVADAVPAELLARLERADVVFVGEQHDDPETHRAEAELLDAIGRS